MNDVLTLEGLIAWTARDAGAAFDDPDESDAYALANFVGGVVEAAGEELSEESVVKALTTNCRISDSWLLQVFGHGVVTAIVSDPVLLRFFVLRHKESAIIHNQPIEGGILDQKLAEAEALIGSIWRYVP